MTKRYIVIVFLAGAAAVLGAGYFMRDRDSEPALVIDEPNQVLTGLVADMGETSYSVVYRVRNRGGRTHLVVGMSDDC